MEQDAPVGTPAVAPADRLVSLLELEKLDRDLYRAWNPAQPFGRNRALFGGQVAAHALRAAALTIEVEHHPHSLHGYFLRPGKSDAPTLLRVDRIRDGRSFSTRTVVALQDGEAIFSLTASFQKDEPSPEHHAPIAPEVPTPTQLLAQGLEPHDHWFTDSPFEVFDVPEQVLAGSPRRAMWIRTRGALPDDRALHASVVTYLSDMGPMGAVRKALGTEREFASGASLDHSVWFHRHVRPDQWLLFDVRGVSGGGARGVATGAVHTEDGVHAATVAQEALIRLAPAQPPATS